MRRGVGVSLSVYMLVGLALTSAARSETTFVAGSARTTVLQFAGPFPIQTDINQELIPLTKPQPPLTATSRLDRLATDGTTSAAGQALATLFAPNLTGQGNPSDAGLDIGAFSDDDITGWFVESQVSETRSIKLSPAEIGETQGPLGAVGRVRSRVLLSGVMLVASEKQGQDLTGVEASINFSVVQRIGNRAAQTVLAGEVALTGGPDSSVAVNRATGALAGVFLPILNFSDQVPEIPFVQAILFTGIDLPYEYEAVPNDAFQLELIVRGQVKTRPGGTAAAATFGVPQDGLGAVFERVKKDDRGRSIANLIAQRVDTTGQQYLTDGPQGLGLPNLSTLCGTVGIESAALLIPACLVVTSASARRRRRTASDSARVRK
jgi:hypothetical protein